MDENNQQNLDQIDSIYNDTTSLEAQFIGKKMENMNLINNSELTGIKFLHQYAQNDRQIDSLNEQINSIRQIMAMLDNEISISELDKKQIDTVYQKEQELLKLRDNMLKLNDTKV